MNLASTIHATAVLVGAKAVLIRGASGRGKSRLALNLLQRLRFARLVGDDRVHLEVSSDRLLVRPAKELAGRLEVRGLGIRTVPFEPVAVVKLVVDLAADAERMPDPADSEVVISGIGLARLVLPQSADPLPAVLARLGVGGI